MFSNFHAFQPNQGNQNVNNITNVTKISTGFQFLSNMQSPRLTMNSYSLKNSSTTVARTNEEIIAASIFPNNPYQYSPISDFPQVLKPFDNEQNPNLISGFDNFCIDISKEAFEPKTHLPLSAFLHPEQNASIPQLTPRKTETFSKNSANPPMNPFFNRPGPSSVQFSYAAKGTSGSSGQFATWNTIADNQYYQRMASISTTSALATDLQSKQRNILVAEQASLQQLPVQLNDVPSTPKQQTRKRKNQIIQNPMESTKQQKVPKKRCRKFKADTIEAATNSDTNLKSNGETGCSIEQISLSIDNMIKDGNKEELEKLLRIIGEKFGYRPKSVGENKKKKSETKIKKTRYAKPLTEEQMMRSVRKSNMAFPKGTFLIRFSDLDKPESGHLWRVDNYELLEKYLPEPELEGSHRIFAKSNRLTGWYCDRPWEYLVVRTIGSPREDGKIVADYPTLEMLKEAQAIAAASMPKESSIEK